MDKPVAWVTGASRGIGAAVADRLAQDGFYVVGTATQAEGAQAVAERLNKLGAGEGLAVDVGDGDQLNSVFSECLKRLGAPEVLINNAGITRDGLLIRMKDTDWQGVVDINLTAVFQLSRLVAKGMMKARYGRIINISSVVAAMGNAGQANYAAAKGGVEAMTRTMAKELGSRGITVNAVAPGFIETDMTRKLNDSQREAMLTAVPAARLGQPEEVAAAVSFLASKDAGYITGEVLHINGGLYSA